MYQFSFGFYFTQLGKHQNFLTDLNEGLRDGKENSKYPLMDDLNHKPQRSLNPKFVQI